jgi:hypothetical protein
MAPADQLMADRAHQMGFARAGIAEDTDVGGAGKKLPLAKRSHLTAHRGRFSFVSNTGVTPGRRVYRLAARRKRRQTMDQDRKMQGMGTTDMCLMARMCKAMAERPGFAFLLLIPGLLLILGGALIFIEPRVLVRFMASASIFIGIMMLFFAIFIRKMSARFTNAGG